MQGRFAQFLGVAGMALASVVAAGPGPAVLVDMEHQFARDAATRGTRAAFLAHLSPEGIVFTDRPVNGVERWTPLPASASRLAWEPDVAEVSSGGELGWTSGPWSWRPDSSARPQAFGRYFTIWRLERGEWKAVLDGGISHDSIPLPTSASLQTLRSPKPVLRANAEATLTATEDAYAMVAARSGTAAALRRFADPEVRALRPGRLVWIGLRTAADSLTRLEPRATLRRAALHGCAAGDMGYAYGSLILDGGAAADTSSYVHLWHRRRGGAWALAVDVRIPSR